MTPLTCRCTYLTQKSLRLSCSRHLSATHLFSAASFFLSAISIFRFISVCFSFISWICLPVVRRAISLFRSSYKKKKKQSHDRLRLDAKNTHSSSLKHLLRKENQIIFSLTFLDLLIVGAPAQVGSLQTFRLGNDRGNNFGRGQSSDRGLYNTLHCV